MNIIEMMSHQVQYSLSHAEKIDYCIGAAILVVVILLVAGERV